MKIQHNRGILLAIIKYLPNPKQVPTASHSLVGMECPRMDIHIDLGRLHCS